MPSDRDWLLKYGSEAGRRKMEAPRLKWTPELQARVNREWNELIADVERSSHELPSSMRAQSLADRWTGLREEFTNRDKDIEVCVSEMWKDRHNWSAEISEKAPCRNFRCVALYSESACLLWLCPKFLLRQTFATGASIRYFHVKNRFAYLRS